MTIWKLNRFGHQNVLITDKSYFGSCVTSVVFILFLFLFLFFWEHSPQEKSVRQTGQCIKSNQMVNTPGIHKSKQNLSSQNSGIPTHIPLECLLSNSPMPTCTPEIWPQMPWSRSPCSDICILHLHLAIAFAIWSTEGLIALEGLCHFVNEMAPLHRRANWGLHPTDIYIDEFLTLLFTCNTCSSLVPVVLV